MPAAGTVDAPLVIRGRLEEHDFTALLAALTRLPATGLLRCERGAVETSLMFWHGQVVMVRSTDTADTVRALERVDDATWAALDLFEWSEGSFVFESGAASTVPTRSVALVELVFGGVARITDRRRLLRLLGGDAARHRFVGASAEIMTTLPLEPREWTLLNLLAEPRVLGALVRASSLPELRVAQVTLACRTLGLLQRCDRPVSPTELLVHRSLSPEEIAARPQGDDLAPGDAWPALRDPARAGEPLDGRLGRLTFPDVLRGLYVAQATGVLSARSDSVTSRFYLSAGTVVSASSTVRGSRLGPTLVRLGDLSPDALAEAERRSGRAPIARHLLESSKVDDARLRAAIERQIRETVRSMVEWTGGTYWFEEKSRGLADLPLPRLSMADVILEYARAIEDVGAVREFFASLPGTVGPAREPRLRHQHVSLRPEEGYLLSRLDCESTIEEALAVSTLDEATSLRLLFGFLATGMIAACDCASRAEPAGRRPVQIAAGARVEHFTPDPTSPAPTVEPLEFAPSSESCHYEVLGLKPGASVADVEEAHRVLAATCHPDKAETPQQKAILEVMFARMNEARRVLTSRDERSAYDGLIDSSQPDGSDEVETEQDAQAPVASAAARAELVGRLVRAGIDAHRRYDYVEALRYLERAVILDGENVVCLVHLGQVLAVNPKWQRRAIDVFEEALALAPGNVDARLGIAEIYRKSGRRELAMARYREVLEYAPSNEVAITALDELRPVVGSALGEAVRGVLRRKKPTGVT